MHKCVSQAVLVVVQDRTGGDAGSTLAKSLHSVTALERMDADTLRAVTESILGRKSGRGSRIR